MKGWNYSEFNISEISSEAPDSFKVADELRICIEAALDELGISLDIPGAQEVPGFYPDNIRINKLAYMAIEELDLPLVSTWYKYGQYEPYESLRADRLDLGPASHSTALVYEHPQRGSFTRGRVISFFTNKESLLRTLWDYNQWEFMEFNYGRRAPDHLKEMYLANTTILKVIDKLYKGDYTPHKHREEFKESTLDLRYELENVRAIPPDVTSKIEEFLYSFEEALVAYDNLDEPTKRQIKLLRSAKPLYHQVIWQVPALAIAADEVSGPDEGSYEYQKRLESHISDSIDELDKGVNEWKEGIEEANLQPTGRAFSSVRSKPSELKDLEKSMVSKTSNDGR